MTPVQSHCFARSSTIASVLTPEDHEVLARAGSFRAMSIVPIRVLERLSAEGRPVVQLSGPMTTGGLGNPDLNFRLYREAVRHAYDRMVNVHDVTAYKAPLDHLCGQLPMGNPYPWDLLNDFYAPMFQSQYVTHLWLLPGWNTSTGSAFEVVEASMNGVRVENYPVMWYVDVCAKCNIDPLV